REFLEHFNLKNLEELPPLSALRDLDVISNELNLRLDLEQTAVSSRDGMTAAGDGSHDGMEEEQESAILSEAKSAERE
ncbi:MAG: hypothetical protein OEM83_02770, partial [Gammaproteobacteria bacterium]|nr:hypothetical protein [Gammaproteobacteria bacterium]